MFKQKFIPLASMAVLLFSCGGGPKTINLNNYSLLGGIISSLSSENTDFVEGTKYKLEIDLSKIEKSVSHYNALLIGEISQKSSKSYQIFDEETFDISWNGEKLTRKTLTAEYTFNDYTEDVEHSKPDVQKTFAFGNMEGENIYAVIFCTIGLQTKDKLSITGTCKNAKSGIQAVYMNYPMEE